MAGGRTPTGRDAVAWAKEVYERGAGEILLTSMDKDGTKSGFDLPLTKAVTDVVGIPVSRLRAAAAASRIFPRCSSRPGCDAALAASLFHYRELTVKRSRSTQRKNIPVRL